MAAGVGRRLVDSLIFLSTNGGGTRYSLKRGFQFRNDDRIPIPGLTPPTALQMARNGRRLAPVLFENGNLISSPPLEIRAAQTILTISDGASTFLIGGMTKLDTEKTETIPRLNRLPVVGALFRNTDSQGDKNELLILVHPSIIDRD